MESNMESNRPGNTLKKAIEHLPAKDATLPQLIAFCQTYNPIQEFQTRWKTDHTKRIRELWSRSTHAFKNKQPIEATPDELLMCMAYDATVAPYIGVPAKISHAYLHYVLKELRDRLAP